MLGRSWSEVVTYELEPNRNNRLNPYDNSVRLVEKLIFREPTIDYDFNDYDSDEQESADTNVEGDEEQKRISYCYLCSIKAHVHKKTQPVPMHKRRFLRPYLNPLELSKRLNRERQEDVIKTKYKFIIQTGSAKNAGTDANVWFQLYGTAGTWEACELKSAKVNSQAKFTPGSLVELYMDGPVVGDLKTLKIWHTGLSHVDNWYLDFVEITCFKLNQTWRFVCDQWIAKNKNTNPIHLSLKNNFYDNEKIKNSTEYAIMIKTLGKHLPAQDVNVQFQFVCSKGQTQVFNLLTPYVSLFEPYQLDCFLVKSSHDLGKPEKLRMAHNARKLEAGWEIDSINVYYSRDPNNFYSFKIDKWLDKNDKMNAIISPNPVIPITSNDPSESGKMIYHISVITGKIRMAGTDAKVYIQLKGTNGISDLHRLHNSKSKREFEQGKVDHFHILDKNIGPIIQARIFHDNSGVAPGWFLEAILIRPIGTSITGRADKHNADLKQQLEKLIKKFKIIDLNMDKFLDKQSNKSQSRSKSAEPIEARRRSGKSSPRTSATTTNGKDSARSLSADSTRSSSTDPVNYKNVLKKNMEKSKTTGDLSRSSPTSSILKTSASPRKDSARKQVKFDPNETHSSSSTAEAHKKTPNSKSPTAQKQDPTGANNPQQTKPEMKMNWIMSINYEANTNEIKSIDTIEKHDKKLKSVDAKMVIAYNEKMKKLDRLTSPVPAGTDDQPATSTTQAKPTSPVVSTKAKADDLIYVFECNKWLAKDRDDRQLERVLKVSYHLAAK